MDVIYTHCAGLDVHKKTVVACCMTPGPQGEKRIEHRTLGTMTADLLALSDWLHSQGITHVALESTGEFWKPIYNLFEGQFEILLVNAQHIKHVPGRKTDVKDAEWLADCLRHGLLRASYVPPRPQRDLRDLTRQRTNLVQDRATVVNRLQKVLEWANLKLAAVATDVTGVSARAMLEAILAGQGDPQVLAELARGRLRHKQAELERALAGRVREHHRFLIANHLTQIDFLDEQIALFDSEIARYVEQQAQPPADPPMPRQADTQLGDPALGSVDQPLSWEAAVALLDTIPGVGRRNAEQLLAEIGTDMRRFPSEAHLAGWAKLAPGNNESAGKRYSGKIGKGNRWLRTCLVQAAHAAVRGKDSYLKSVYHRLVGRRGAKRAIIAVAHRILIAIYHMLSQHEPWHELGATYLDERNKSRLLNRMTRRMERLGYRVTLEPAAVAAA
jgi:transposase